MRLAWEHFLADEFRLFVRRRLLGQWQGEASSHQGWAMEEATKLLNHLLHPVQCQLPCDTAGQGILGHRSCSGVPTATLTPTGVCCDLQCPSASARWDFRSYLGHRVASVALA